ncbi:hypothetical protein [Corynebacterium sp. J010B-136]|uniref:hypothetical protein n=1 Tax=Corynebacterium sp. J010B-136 TaxID=2099401 RepID=UPI000CF9AB98|nr:hypothetical protein [Corynebacterium sp. J010B-136]PQM73991.1 hypothetical protein C5Y44_09105 [Corynebacterium sp. J010B-136]
MAAAKKGELVPRPLKKTEYEIHFATNDARKGWRDLVATIRNPITETWDFLTRTPLATTPTNYRLKGDLSTVQRAGKSYDRWQHKPTAKGAARIWFYVDGHKVFLEQVHTSHPNETK